MMGRRDGGQDPVVGGDLNGLTIHDMTAGCLKECGDLHYGAAWRAFLLFSFFGWMDWLGYLLGQASLDQMHNTGNEGLSGFHDRLVGGVGASDWAR